MEKIVLQKNYSRDFTLILEQLWVGAFKRNIKAEYGFETPYPPYVVLHVTDENLEIWEHEKAIGSFQDWLLEKNTVSTDFLRQIVREYEDLMAVIEGHWKRGGTKDLETIAEYLAASEKAVTLFCIWYYSCIDERTPETAQAIARPLREKDEFFAKNDKHIKDCVVALGGKRELANLILLSEFPNIPSEETLRARTSGVVVVDADEVFFSPLPQFAAEHPEYVFEDLQPITETPKELSGSIAYKGSVTGRVRVVKNVRAMDGVHDGDIIVSPMTTPDFIAAMRRAAAFVTDEGGIMCHAAIVAREMKKPCITGTKFATQVLRDGDLVEVDADRGVVRILK
ncbi:MAG: PEP-utilizing enzyme [Candidatus Paceibacterota bacterium]|jgi:phosphohistidine swiveling domain-containing protein